MLIHHCPVVLFSLSLRRILPLKAKLLVPVALVSFAVQPKARGTADIDTVFVENFNLIGDESSGRLNAITSESGVKFSISAPHRGACVSGDEEFFRLVPSMSDISRTFLRRHPEVNDICMMLDDSTAKSLGLFLSTTCSGTPADNNTSCRNIPLTT